MDEDRSSDNESLQLLIPAYALMIATGIGLRWWHFHQWSAPNVSPIDLKFFGAAGVMLISAVFEASCRDVSQAYDEHMSQLTGIKMENRYCLCVIGHLVTPLTVGAFVASLAVFVVFRGAGSWGQLGLDLVSPIVSYAGLRIVSTIKS